MPGGDTAPVPTNSEIVTKAEARGPMNNADMARAACEALNARDFGAFLALTDPRSSSPRHRRRWRASTSRATTDAGLVGPVTASLGGLAFDLVEARELPNDMLVIHNCVHGEVGGVKAEQHMWQAVRTREGLAYWWGTFRTEQEALAAL